MCFDNKRLASEKKRALKKVVSSSVENNYFALNEKCS